jgi:uncharacterized protein YqgV (UPF0045/DUF77 family)
MISKPFDISHIDLIDTKINYRDLNELKAEVYPFEGDESGTYIEDGRIIFSCGIKMVRPGVGHCWVIPSKYVDNHSRSFFKEISRVLKEYSAKMNIHRMQTTIKDDFVKWIETLGFERESVLKEIGSDRSDEYMYVKFY